MFTLFLILAVCFGLSSGQNSDLTSLLQMIANVTGTPPEWNPSTPACNWTGVTCDESSKRVTSIYWTFLTMADTMNFSSFPVYVEYVNVGGTALSNAPLNLDHLPPKLKQLHLSTNRFGGPLSVSNLPPTLHHLGLSCNLFTGTPDLTKLPIVMDHLDLSNNNFCGAMTAASTSTAWCRSFCSGWVCADGPVLPPPGECGGLNATVTCPSIICPAC